MAFAGFEFKNARRASDGATEGEHKASAAKQMAALGWKQAAEEVLPDPPPFPSEMSYLWSWYCQHSLGLVVNGMSPAVVTWEGIAAWSHLMGLALEPWETLTIIRLGNLRANIESEKINTAAKQNK
jgi:hypothetical protein